MVRFLAMGALDTDFVNVYLVAGGTHGVGARTKKIY